MSVTSPEQKRSLGTLLRQLVHLLDDDVEAIYAREGLPFRSRYTPVVKSLLRREGASIRELAADAGLSHSALSQTIRQMTREGLVTAGPGADPRERHVRLTPAARALMPRILECWVAFDKAAELLGEDVGLPLSEVAGRAISALEARPFRARVEDHLGRRGRAPGA